LQGLPWTTQLRGNEMRLVLWVLSLMVVAVAAVLIAVSCSSDDAPDCPTGDRCTVDGLWKVREVEP
jgi:hypothetical protein